MTKEEIIARRLSAQHLLSPAGAEAIAGNLCGVQAQFLSHALHGLKIRGADNADGLIKSWTIRGTMHLFPEKDLPLFLYNGREHFLRDVDTMQSDAYMSAERKEYFSKLILDTIARGTDDREDLKNICENAGMSESESFSAFNPWGGLIRAMCEEGKICHKVQEKKAYSLCPRFQPMEKQDARLELLRRYFKAFGPASIKDAAAFFGFTQREIKSYLPLLPLKEIAFEGKSYFYNDSEIQKGHIPDCLFLSGFDQFLLGYEKKESLILPSEHIRDIYTLAGIVRPALLIDGKVAGYWNLKNKKLSITMFENGNEEKIKSEANVIWTDLKEIKFT
ncbi:MAG: AlkZ family DNA glycosylase [Oscillospiraceae bacterium]|nr:AlkZ family DNA glycosylase [Oscillospiraceae bacterium]